MGETGRFRTSLGGFNRQDVANYIEKTARRHQESLQQLRDEAARLTAERDALKAELDAVRAQLENALEGVQMPAVPEGDPESLELAAYRRAEAAERSANARILRQTQKLDQIMDGLREQYAAAGQELTELTRTVEESTEKMQALFGRLDESFGKTAGDMQQLREENRAE